MACSPKSNTNQSMKLEDITPEIAAYVVKNYLLPMFDADLKKAQRKNRRGLISPEKKEENTVYGELKLSEKLQLEIYTLREEKERLTEQLEALTYASKSHSKQVRTLQLQLESTRHSNTQLKQALHRAQNAQHSQRCDVVIAGDAKNEVLTLAKTSERYRKEGCYRLEAAKVEIEKQNNQIIGLKQQLSLAKTELEIVGDQLKRLYDAIQYLGDGKMTADQKQFEFDMISHKNVEILAEKEVVDQEF